MQAPDDWRQHGIVIARADKIRTQGKYGVHLLDVTNFQVTDYTVDAHSDGVHVNGPAADGLISGVVGTTGDDTVAITALDGFPQYQDSAGAWTRIHVEHVYATSGTAELKFRSDGVAGECTGSAFDVHAPTRINLDGGLVGGGRMALSFDSCHGYFIVGNAYSTTAPKASTITSLKITNQRYTVASTVNRRVVDITGYVTVEHLAIDGCTVETTADATAIVGLTVAAKITTLTLNNWSIRGGTNGYVVYISGATNECRNAHLSNGTIYNSTNSGVVFFVPVSAGGARVDVLAMSNVRGEQVNKLASLYTPCAVFLSNCWVSANGIQTGAYPVTVYANGLVATTGHQIGTANQVHSLGFDFRVDVSLLAKTAGDTAWNTNGALACGVGPVITDGTAWKNLYSGAVYTP